MRSSSSELALVEKTYGSKGRSPGVPVGWVGEAMLTVTGLIPHDSDLNEAVIGSDRFPSLSTTTTEAVHVPDGTSAMNVGVDDVTELSTDALPAGLLTSDHRYEYAVLPGLRQREVGAADSIAVSSRKNIPGRYPAVLLVREIEPVLGTTSEQLMKSSVSASACAIGPSSESFTS